MMKNEAERGVVGIYDGHNGDAPRITEQYEVWAGENYGVHEHKVNQGNSLVAHLSEVATSGRDAGTDEGVIVTLTDALSVDCGAGRRKEEAFNVDTLRKVCAEAIREGAAGETQSMALLRGTPCEAPGYPNREIVSR